MAYRAISSAGLPFLLRNTFEEVSENSDICGVKEDASSIQNLINCCKLVTHNGSNLYSAPELMKESFVAVFLTRCLQARGFFNKKNLSDENIMFTEDQMQVAVWMHHLMRVAKFNSHEVTEFTTDAKEKSESGSREYAR